MRFYSEAECAERCERLNVVLDDRRQPIREFAHPYRLQCGFPSFTQSLWFSRVIESALQPREACLLWVTDWGIFRSNENLHLYYRLRQSYGDFRLINEAPGHFCLDYESPEVVTIIQLCALFGWDVYLIPIAGYARAFICHDEFVTLGFDNKPEFEATVKALAEGDVEIFEQHSD